MSEDALRAILFDFDGTLAECRIDFPAMREDVLSLLPEFGLVREEFHGWLVLEILKEADRRLTPDQAARLQGEADRRLRLRELDAARGAGWLPGIPEVLDWLHRRGVQLGVLTRNHREAVEMRLARMPLRLDAFLTRDDVPHPKPHPDHALRVLALLGVPAHRAWLVGDHPMDMECARAAGVRPVGVLTGGSRAEDLAAAGAWRVLPSVAALPEVLDDE